jgi:hypothetical protein
LLLNLTFFKSRIFCRLTDETHANHILPFLTKHNFHMQHNQIRLTRWLRDMSPSDIESFTGGLITPGRLLEIETGTTAIRKEEALAINSLLSDRHGDGIWFGPPCAVPEMEQAVQK